MLVPGVEISVSPAHTDQWKAFQCRHKEQHMERHWGVEQSSLFELLQEHIDGQDYEG